MSGCGCIVQQEIADREKETKARLMRSTLIVSTTGLAKKAMKEAQEAEEARLAAEAEAEEARLAEENAARVT